jgi:serine/threonine protein kinase
MELAAGDTLAAKIGRGALPSDQALPIALQIAVALEATHEKGILHRDLKPANIVVASDGKVKVLDLGLATVGEAAYPDAAAAPDLTHSPTMYAGTMAGVILGTAAYMSPEQARGKAADKRSVVGI